MAKYIDGFVFVVPKSRVAVYKKMAEEGAASWKKHGALEYFECMGQDLVPKPQGGEKALAFTKMTKAKPNETVWFSFIVYRSKKHRDDVNKKVMNEMNEKYKDTKDFSMPFDMKRFAYGGFEVAVEA